jgi:hypothetical protein
VRAGIGLLVLTKHRIENRAAANALAAATLSSSNSAIPADMTVLRDQNRDIVNKKGAV